MNGDQGSGGECPILLKADIQLAVSERPRFAKGDIRITRVFLPPTAAYG